MVVIFVVVYVVCKCRMRFTIEIPLLSCFFYQERFCLFDLNYQNDENNNDDDDYILSQQQIFFFKFFD